MAPKSAEGKGKGGGKAAPKKKPATLNKNRALAALTSDTKLSADDDERTSMSKKISWILRKGAERINIEIDSEGWVKLADLMKAEILDDFPDRTEESLMANIAESNKQKLRYETKESPNGTMVRALKKTEKDAAKKRDEPGEKIEITLAPEANSGLRGDAPEFVPGQAAASSPTAAMMGGYGMGGYPGFGFPPFGYPWPYGAFPGMPGGAASPGGSGAQQRFQGRIKSFNQEKGYGFIESAEANRMYGRDVFLHKAHVGELAVGAMVTFTVGMNKQNMPQARDLLPAEGGGGGKGGKGGKDGKGKSKPKAKAKTKKDKGEKKDDDAAAPAGDEAKPEGESSAPAAPEATAD